MDNCQPIIIAVEDPVSEAMIKSIIFQTGIAFDIRSCHGLQGFGYLKKNIRAFNNAARSIPCVVLTDLDTGECAPRLIREWLPIRKHNKLIFRVAVREVESWVLAHRNAFADYFGISPDLVPLRPDELPDPKRKLIELAQLSRKREIREAVCLRTGTTARQGRGYNIALPRFIQNDWKVEEAINNSNSLDKAYRAILSIPL